MADQLDLDVDKFTNLLITNNEQVSSCSVISYKNLIGRNYDWMRDAIRTLELFSASVNGYNQIIAIREGGFPILNRMNILVKKKRFTVLIIKTIYILFHFVLILSIINICTLVCYG